MIDNDKQLEDFLLRIENQTQLAIDTEFKRINTYYPTLCLLQIATKNAIDCIDVLAIKNLQPLFDKLYQPDCLWILHSARQDIEAIYQLSGLLPKQLFDTQIGANFLNYPQQISYQELTEKLQNVVLEKSYTRIDWSIRPLTDGAVKYALDDVYYLLKNYQQLKIQLENGQKLAWAIEDFDDLLDINLYEIDITQAWNKVKGFSRLNQQFHRFGMQLAAWREYQAINKNRPRKWIITDNDLIDYARGTKSLYGSKQRQFDEFLDAHPQLQNIDCNIVKYAPLTTDEKAQKTILQKIIKHKANQYNIDDKVIASTKTLLRYVQKSQSVNLLKGWRYQLLKKELKNAK